MSDVHFSEEGWEDFSYWLTQDKKTLVRIMKLIADIERTGIRQSTHPHYNQETLNVIRDAEAGKGLSKIYTDPDELYKDLGI